MKKIILLLATLISYNLYSVNNFDIKLENNRKKGSVSVIVRQSTPFKIKTKPFTLKPNESKVANTGDFEELYVVKTENLSKENHWQKVDVESLRNKYQGNNVLIKLTSVPFYGLHLTDQSLGSPAPSFDPKDIKAEAYKLLKATESSSPAEILKVKENASPNEIKKAFDHLEKQWDAIEMEHLGSGDKHWFYSDWTNKLHKKYMEILNQAKNSLQK